MGNKKACWASVFGRKIFVVKAVFVRWYPCEILLLEALAYGWYPSSCHLVNRASWSAVQ